MKTIALILVTLGMAARALAVEPAWQTSLPEAADQARQENKLLLLDFTGSDWCHWCMKLDEEVFSRAEFINYAAKNLVLVKVNFPMHKAQADDEKEANRALKKKYGVQGFPSVLILKPDGTVLWNQRGYAPGGPGAMIDAANQCRRASGLGAPVQPAATAPPAPAQSAAPVVAAAPVQPPAAPPQNSGKAPKLQGIFYSTSHASVVLDGKMCEEGETVHGMRVLKIAQDKVTVEYQGQIKLLKMMETEGITIVSKMN